MRAMTTVGFVGLGAMGSRMARRLVDAGYEVLAWNRTTAKVRRLAGATPADTPAGVAAHADVVITMVADPVALRAVTEGPDGVAAGVRTGSTVVEMSTVGPAAVARLASVLPDGVGLLDAPVLGSVSEAEAGTLSIFIGGPAGLAHEQSVLSVLSVLGSPVHVGPLGAGAAAKLVANSTLFGVLGVLGEALALADGLGLSREAAFDVLAATPIAAQAKRRRPAIESGEYPARFSLAMARKDADLLLDAATAAGVELRLAPAARSWLADTQHDGQQDQDLDYSAVLTRILANAP
jgi:3-hydroxyisobutyrate dehydrogenase-like beta-hydroxyacid dehydrogenase